MKRLTLDQTWTQCLKMWRCIAKQTRAAIKADKGWDSVETLKAKWVDKHGLENACLCDHCFFCEYAYLATTPEECPTWSEKCWKCPAKKIDKDFYCKHPEYNFQSNPIAFYKKLVALNKIRLARKK